MASRSSPGTDTEPSPDDVELSVLRERVANLEGDLAEREHELAAARDWAEFLEASLEERRERVAELESRVEDLEAELARERRSSDLLGRVRALFA